WHDFYSNQFNVSDVPFENMRLIETRYHMENALIDAVRNANEEKAIELDASFNQLNMPPPSGQYAPGSKRSCHYV
ncbi:MAG: hypothetical protein Q4D42_10465, partial [Eubacteriales bacterium]|nr:hypothetical protein [Eubacteriales bacterium]